MLSKEILQSRAADNQDATPGLQCKVRANLIGIRASQKSTVSTKGMPRSSSSSNSLKREAAEIQSDMTTPIQ
jgi:hypothetical protein